MFQSQTTSRLVILPYRNLLDPPTHLHLGNLRHPLFGKIHAWVRVCMLIHVQLSVTACTAAHQAPLSMEFSRREHWKPFPSLGDLLDQGSNTQLLLWQVNSLPLRHLAHTHLPSTWLNSPKSRFMLHSKKQSRDHHQEDGWQGILCIETFFYPILKIDSIPHSLVVPARQEAE